MEGHGGKGYLTRTWHINFLLPPSVLGHLPAFSGLSSPVNHTHSSQVPKAGNLPLTTEVLKSLATPLALEKKPQVAYKTEIIGGVVVHTPINQVLGPGAARLGHGGSGGVHGVSVT